MLLIGIMLRILFLLIIINNNFDYIKIFIVICNVFEFKYDKKYIKYFNKKSVIFYFIYIDMKFCETKRTAYL